MILLIFLSILMAIRIQAAPSDPDDKSDDSSKGDAHHDLNKLKQMIKSMKDLVSDAAASKKRSLFIQDGVVLVDHEAETAKRNSPSWRTPIWIWNGDLIRGPSALSFFLQHRSPDAIIVDNGTLYRGYYAFQRGFLLRIQRLLKRHYISSGVLHRDDALRNPVVNQTPLRLPSRSSVSY